MSKILVPLILVLSLSIASPSFALGDRTVLQIRYIGFTGIACGLLLFASSFGGWDLREQYISESRASYEQYIRGELIRKEKAAVRRGAGALITLGGLVVFGFSTLLYKDSELYDAD